MLGIFNIKLITFPFLDTVNGDCDCDCTTNSNLNIADGFTAAFAAQLTTLFLELTPACNNRCNGCSNVFIKDKPLRKLDAIAAPMALAEWRKILSKVSPSISRLSITGGEPTLYQDFLQFIDLLDEYGISFTLFTNGRWQRPEQLVRALQKQKNLVGLLISVHGVDASSHEAFTLIPGSFKETLENIKYLTQCSIPVTLSCVITRYNFWQVSAIYQLGAELGVEKVVFNRYVGFAQDDCAPTPNQLKHALMDVEGLRLKGASVKLSVTVPQCFHPTSAVGCGAGHNFFTIDPWGNVKPCNHTPMILGNLKYDTLEKILASTQLQSWLNLPLAACGGCTALAICGGGCRAEAMLNHKQTDSLMSQPLILAEDKEFFFLPDYLHPVTVQDFAIADLRPEIDEFMKQNLHKSLDGASTLKSLGIQYGQDFLDLLGALYKEEVIQFV